MNFIIFSDYDECDINNAGCQQNCHNTDGGYYCSCNQGYVISDDHYSCNGKQIASPVNQSIVSVSV